MSRLTEIKIINVNSCSLPNEVYLCWLSINGGWSYWKFTTNQKISLDVSGGNVIKNNISNLETATQKSEYLNKSAEKKMIIGADNLTTEEIYGDGSNYFGLSGLAMSIDVKMLISWSPPSAPVWQGVQVSPGSFKLVETKDLRHSIELTLKFPDILIQSK